jgi:Flp pilus assembly protein TadB
MTTKAYYKERTDHFRQKAEALQKKENQLSLARLISFLSGIVIFFGLISITIQGAIFGLLGGLVVFAWLVKQYAKNEKAKNTFRYLEEINHKEEQCLHGNYFEYPDGSQYVDAGHPYSYDLDIFGHASLFQYINRTTSKPAADLLAEWLKTPGSFGEISKRQQAVKELMPMMDWRQELITLGYESSAAAKDPREIMHWAKSRNFFLSRSYVKMVALVLSGLSLTTTVLVIAGFPVALLAIVLVVNFFYYFTQAKLISQLHNQVGKSSDMLNLYASTIRMIENRNFESEKLRVLQDIFVKGKPVSAQIGQLAKIAGRLDVRLNVMVSIPLNLFFFWDIHCCYMLEQWKTEHATDISRWFAAMAEFEVISSLSNMAYNNPEWVMPVVVPDYFVLEALDAGHPLIPVIHRITSTLTIDHNGKAVIVTGSNMSGKSTFLRTCGVNAVLALAGAPVCASSFKISHVHLFSSMRISDSLEDNTSSFYAELKKLAAMIKHAAGNQKVFLLLDEILRGTNSNDRYTGSVALIRQLIRYGTVTIIATHDLKLADMEAQLPGQIDNYHFDVKIDGDELYFDYKLTPGICQSLNASILMKKMGIEISGQE